MMSAGQIVLVPSQVSAVSQTPAEPRHIAPAFPAGCWQTGLDPSHRSTVHGLPSSLHAMPAATSTSAGQLGPVPVQNSAAASHSPDTGRHSTELGWKSSAGQPALDPVHVSATSHTSTAGRQTVVLGMKALSGQIVLVPSQVAATSQPSGPAARQTVPALPAVCMQAPLPSHWSTVHALPSSVHGLALASN